MVDVLLEKAAVQFRSEHGISTKDAIRLKSLLQKLNTITIFKPLVHDFSGMALKTGNHENVYRFMLVNSGQSTGKQHFTICHELYHLYIQKNFVSRICKTGLFDKKQDREEYNADVFASFLLLPTDGLIELIPDKELHEKQISLSTIVYLEQFFSCSRRALLYRLKRMKLITDAIYDLYTPNVKRSALEYGYNTSLYEPGNDGVIIGDYGTSAKKLFDKDLISQSHYFSLLADLGINISAIENDPDGEE